MKINRIAKQVKRAARRKRKKPKEHDAQYLPTGCTLLNLAISDDPFGGFQAGRYFYLVGDSASGKTFFSMTCFAEACKHPAFKHYRLIYDNTEDGMQMDVQRLFGPKVLAKIENPGGEGVNSHTIEEFYYHLDDALRREDEPFIYVLDSMDGLTSEAEEGKFEKQKTAHRKGKEAAGSYGDGKAKKNSAGIRVARHKLEKHGSILIVISQTRDNPAAGPFQSKKTRSGGRALKFYATTEIWTAVGGRIKKTVRKKNRAIGTRVKINLQKNRVTGKLHEVWTAIYPSYGVDDIGSNIDYLMRESWWKKSGQKIKATEFDLVCVREKLIREIESSSKSVKKLQRLVGKCWAEIEKACALDRKQRYQ